MPFYDEDMLSFFLWLLEYLEYKNGYLVHVGVPTVDATVSPAHVASRSTNGYGYGGFTKAIAVHMAAN